MRYIVDRFENGYAVCEMEDGNIKNIPKYQLPLEVKEGDMLIVENGFYRVLDIETKKRRGELRERLRKTSKGEDVFIFTLENANGTIAKISTLGAVLVSLFTKDREGKFCDIVLGYDEVEQYEKNKPGFGATIGRNANRIRNASFSLNGKQYVLEKNDGNNNLHSGFSGYQHRIWEAKEKETTLGDSIEFCYHSLDKDQGFPGNLDVSVSYTLTEDDRLILHYKGTADEDTVLNMTNHSYFNLAGHDSGDVLKQKVTIYADYFTASDKEFIPTGEILSVKGTPMDFNISKEIGMDIESNYEAIVLGKGYDHNWILKKEENEKICLAAKRFILICQECNFIPLIS